MMNLYSGQLVDVEDSTGAKRKCEVEGIGFEYGGITIREVDTGKVIEVHPDYNSFDLMKGLVYPKK